MLREGKQLRYLKMKGYHHLLYELIICSDLPFLMVKNSSKSWSGFQDWGGRCCWAFSWASGNWMLCYIGHGYDMTYCSKNFFFLTLLFALHFFTGQGATRHDKSSCLLHWGHIRMLTSESVSSLILQWCTSLYEDSTFTGCKCVLAVLEDLVQMWYTAMPVMQERCQ